MDRVPRQLLRHPASRARLDDPDAPDIVLEIELDGAQQVKQQYPEAVLIFVLPPSREEQERRLRGRGDPGDKVLARLRKAELEEPIGSQQADHVVVNDELDRTVDEMMAIIDRERRTCPVGPVESPIAIQSHPHTARELPWPRATTR